MEPGNLVLVQSKRMKFLYAICDHGLSKLSNNFKAHRLAGGTMYGWNVGVADALELPSGSWRRTHMRAKFNPGLCPMRRLPSSQDAWP
jgi:hypothetical protein